MIMATFDPAGEWLRLSQHYSQMSDGELLALAQQNSELTGTAQQALAGEISRRGLKVEPAKPAEPLTPEPPADSPYAEDLKLVEVATVWSLADAIQLQELLKRAGIPFRMGREKAASAETDASNFAEGVSVKVPRIGVPWARQAMQAYTPLSRPVPQGGQDEAVACCPKCHSTEIFLEELIAEPEAESEDPPGRYEWVCDSCGNRWEDDGTADGE
jgi:DNA-directed RNA polymerase subunit M/transcription elongation factor TFIIS